MQREKLYKLQSRAYFNCVLFAFKRSESLCNQFSMLRKAVSQNFASFENKKYTTKISFTLWIVEVFALHLLVYYTFLKKTYYPRKKISRKTAVTSGY